MAKRPNISRYIIGVVLLALLAMLVQTPTPLDIYKSCQSSLPDLGCATSYGMGYYVGFRLFDLVTILIIFIPAVVTLEFMGWNKLWQYLLAGIFLGPVSYYWIYYGEMFEMLIEDGETFWIKDAISDDLVNGIIRGVFSVLVFWFFVYGFRGQRRIKN